jgi:multidrug resistance efflux pump
MLNLSKENTLEERSADSFSSLQRTAPKNTGKKSLRNLILFAIICVAAMFLPWTQNIRSEGTVTALLPGQRPQAVVSMIDGRINNWFVMEGQYVNKGDTLLSISEIKDEYFDTSFVKRAEEQLDAKEKSLIAYLAKIDALNRQIKSLEDLQNVKSRQNVNKIRQSHLKYASDSLELNAEKARYDIAQTQMDRWRDLYNKGLKSKTELEQRELKFRETSANWQSAMNKLSISSNELLNAQAESGSISADYQEKINKTTSELSSAIAAANETELEISKLKNRYASYKVRKGYHAITAPQSGIIARAMRSGIGEIVKPGEELLTILPEGYKPAVELFITATDLPLIKKNENVRILFDGWPAFVFSGWPGASMGTFGGKVVAIDNFSDQKGLFRVLVSPDPKDKKWPDAVKAGSGVKGIFLLKDVPLWYETWRKFNGFPPEFYNPEEKPKK